MSEKKLAVVTGGTRGIGAEISKALIASGFVVAATYQSNDERAQKFKQDTGAEVYKFDVASFDQCGAAIAKIQEELGDITALVNNAGITRDGVLHKMDREDWVSVLSTNLNSCFNMCRHILPSMRNNGYGRIINISSINGQKGQFGQANYAASKAGIIGFTKSVALENAFKGITANVICPGYIATEMTEAIDDKILDSIIAGIPAGRMGHPEEIASLVAYLASKEAGFINGAVVSANGGQFMGG